MDYIHRSENMNIYTCIMCFSAINAMLLRAGNPQCVVTLLNRYQSGDDIPLISIHRLNVLLILLFNMANKRTLMDFFGAKNEK